MAITDRKLIVITGASRSGTTLLSFILRNNEQVFGFKELQFFGDIWNPEYPPPKASRAKLIDAVSTVFARQQNGVMGARISAYARAHATELVASLPDEDQTYPGAFMAAIGQLTDDAGKSIPCLQTPRDIFYAEDLLRIFPQAQIVHMLRDPRAVMASQKRRWQRRILAKDKSNVPLVHSLRVWINFHPYTMAKLWNRATGQAQKLLVHERFTLLRFEDLLVDTEATLLGLCGRLGIDFDSAMLNVGQINSSHQSSVRGARQGLNVDAIDAWRDVLTPAELAITEDLCRNLMRELEYLPTASDEPRSFGKLRYKLSYLLHLLGVLVVNPRRAWIQARALLAGAVVRRPN